MITIRDIRVQFGGVVALDNVSADFSAPVNGIIGPNGAGKTTLMNVISGFVAPRGGEIVKDGTNLLTLPPHRRAHWGLRRSFQKEEIANDLTVFENVLVQCDHSRASRTARHCEVMEMLDLVGLRDHAQTPGQALNSFQRRLTDVAKCLVGGPRLVMFDEPAGGLTTEETRRLGDLITAIPEQTGAQVLVIDHDVELISRICVDTLVLDFGRVIALGPTARVLADPKVKSAYLGTEEG